MELPQILVYDRQNYFFRFLKYKFYKNFKFKKVKNDKNFDDDLGKYQIVVFVMYLESELFDFSKIYSTGVQILVCTYNKNILRRMGNRSNIILLDTSKTKLEMVKELENFLYCLNFQNA